MILYYEWINKDAYRNDQESPKKKDVAECGTDHDIELDESM